MRHFLFWASREYGRRTLIFEIAFSRPRRRTIIWLDTSQLAFFFFLEFLRRANNSPAGLGFMKGPLTTTISFVFPFLYRWYYWTPIFICPTLYHHYRYPTTRFTMDYLDKKPRERKGEGGKHTCAFVLYTHRVTASFFSFLLIPTHQTTIDGKIRSGMVE